MKAPPFYPWFKVGEDEWTELVALAEAREELQAVAHTSRFWRPDPHLPGLCGEWVYGLLTDQEMDRTPEIWHDQRGEDFPGIDVKTTTYWGDPHLLVGNEQGMKARLYFAAAVNLEQRLVKPLGYATRDLITAAPIREYRHGRRHRLMPHELLSADELVARVLARGWKAA
jgi:hypothetical protein